MNEAINGLKHLFSEYELDLPCTDSLEIEHMAIKALEEIQQYRAIGTVEEFREAVEKQTAKKPITKSRGVYDDDNGDYLSDEKYNICPSCNPMREVYMGWIYCRWCGQKLDWSVEE